MCKREPALAFYLMNLWMRSWHELPAGSLENDDDVLADAAMCEPRLWAKIKSKVLRGWTQQNGRLFHTTVTEIAEESFETKQQRSEVETNKTERQRRWREHVKTVSDRLRELGKTPPRGASLDTLERLLKDAEMELETSLHHLQAPTVDDVEIAYKGIEGKGKEDSVLRTEPVPARDVRSELWDEGTSGIRALTGQPTAKAKGLLGRMLKEAGDNCAETLRIVREAQSLKPVDPVAWLLKAALKSGQRDLLNGAPVPGEVERTAANPMGIRISTNRSDW